MKYGAIIAIIAATLLLVGGVWWVVSGKSSEKEATNNVTEVEDSSTDAEQGSDDQEAEEASIVITYTDDGFRLSGNTIKSGETVLVVNESSDDLQFASDPHPQHSDNHELNEPVLAPGEQETFVVHKTGAWGFHNHLNDDHTGMITVID